MPSAARVLPRARRLPPALARTASAGPAASLCLLALLIAAPPASAASAAPASAAGGWSVAPSGGGRPSFYAEGPPGTVLQDTVSVTNTGRAPVDVRLSGTGTGVAIAFAERSVHIPGRTRADVPFTVSVPAAAEPGDRSGAVVARAAGGRTRTVPLRLRVGGPALAALTVEHVAVRGDRITYELVNRGTTVLVPRLAVRADGVFGRVLDRAPRTLPVRLRPSARLKLTEPWPDRPVLDAVDLRLTVTAPGAARETASARVRFVPWGELAGGAGAVAAGAAAVFVARRRGSRTADADPADGDQGGQGDQADGVPADGGAVDGGAVDGVPADGGAVDGGAVDGVPVGGGSVGGVPVGGGAAGGGRGGTGAGQVPRADAGLTAGAVK
ncbi:hypothetical protein ACH41H_20390 [Streptomyces sp. NPDC020800]|uniref:hypothetical protein n=1 Tax=Streptomyces sp. NPDC020800 TaxID=3365092 RepID=UPI0037B8AB8B